MNSKRRRASCIVEMPNQQGEMCFLVSHQEGDKFHMIPGGGVDQGETALMAGIRELKEETNLDTKAIIKLFDHESEFTIHHVFLQLPEAQVFSAQDDVKSLWLLPIKECTNLTENPLLSRSTKYILNRYLLWRKQNLTTVSQMNSPTPI